MSKSAISIILVSITAAALFSSGSIGFGVDYFALYYKENVISLYRVDALGLFIATFVFSSLRLGLFAVSFFYTYTLGLWYRDIFKIRHVAISLVTSLLSWPHIFNNLNVIRQGVLVAFLLWVLLLLKKKGSSSSVIFLSLLFPLLHRSGFLFTGAMFLIAFLRGLKAGFFFNFFLVVLSVGLFFQALVFAGYDTGTQSKVIGLNLNYFFLPLNFYLSAFVFYQIWRVRIENVCPVSLFVLVSMLLSLPVLYLGMLWEYERIQSVLIVPQLYLASRSVRIRSDQFMSLVIALLAALTFFLGMHDKFGHDISQFSS